MPDKNRKRNKQFSIQQWVVDEVRLFAEREILEDGVTNMLGVGTHALMEEADSEALNYIARHCSGGAYQNVNRIVVGLWAAAR